jgi:hypothetical protein
MGKMSGKKVKSCENYIEIKERSRMKPLISAVLTLIVLILKKILNKKWKDEQNRLLALVYSTRGFTCNKGCSKRKEN